MSAGWDTGAVLVGVGKSLLPWRSFPTRRASPPWASPKLETMHLDDRGVRALVCPARGHPGRACVVLYGGPYCGLHLLRTVHHV